MRWRRPGTRDERGATLVEFGLLCPILFSIILATFSGGISYHRKIQMTSAVREAARSAATISASQTFSPSSNKWKDVVTALLVARAGSDLGSTYTICVSLVEGTGSTTAVITPPSGRSASEYSSASGGGPCIPNELYPPYVAGVDNGRRVQVVVSRPTTIQGIFWSNDVTLTSKATVKSETNG